MRKNRFWRVFVFFNLTVSCIWAEFALVFGAQTATDKTPLAPYEVYEAVFGPSSSREEIQEALDYRKNGRAKKLVITLRGNIAIDGSLYVYSDTTINAYGATITQTKKKASLLASATAARFGSYGYKTGYQMTKNITVNGGVWNGAKKAGQIIHFIHASNITLQGMTVINCTPTGHLISLEGVNTALVSGCVLTGHGEMGASKEALHLDIVHNKETTPGLRMEEYDDLACVNITIRGNTITNVPNAIGSHGAVNGVYHKNIVISNNHIANIGSIGIKLFNYKNTSVRHNTIKNADTGIKAYTYFSDKKGGNKVNGYYSPNYGTRTEALPAGRNYRIEISGNVIQNTREGSAICLQAYEKRPMKSVSITGNSISGSGCRGILLNGYCKNASVAKNLVTDCKLNAIDVRNYSNGSVISENRICRSGENAVNVSKNISNVMVKNNMVEGSNGNGIRVSEAKRVTVLGNRLQSLKRHGVFGLTVSRLKISGNTMQNVRQMAVSLVDAKKSNTASIEATKIKRVTQKTKKKKKTVKIKGMGNKGSSYTVMVGNKKYKAIVQGNRFLVKKSGTIRQGTKITVWEKTSGGNQIITEKQVKAPVKKQGKKQGKKRTKK